MLPATSVSFSAKGQDRSLTASAPDVRISFASPVVNAPKDMVNGIDAQLDYVVEYLQKQLKAHPEKWVVPDVPAYPNKAKPRMSHAH